MKKIKKLLLLISIIAITNLVINILNRYSYIDNTNSIKETKINEEIIFHIEGEEEKININKAKLNDILSRGIDKKTAEKILSKREYLGQIIDYKNLKLRKKELEILNIYFEIIVDENKIIKRNINDLEEVDLIIMGFSKKEIEYIIKKIEKGKINSEFDLENIKNKEIIKNYITF